MLDRGHGRFHFLQGRALLNSFTLNLAFTIAITIAMSPIGDRASEVIGQVNSVEVHFSDGTQGACVEARCVCDEWGMEFFYTPHNSADRSWGAVKKPTLAELEGEIQRLRAVYIDDPRGWEKKYAAQHGPICIIRKGTVHSLADVASMRRLIKARIRNLEIARGLAEDLMSGEPKNATEYTRRTLMKGAFQEYRGALDDAKRQLVDLEKALQSTNTPTDALTQAANAITNRLDAAEAARATVMGYSKAAPSPESTPCANRSGRLPDGRCFGDLAQSTRSPSAGPTSSPQSNAVLRSRSSTSPAGATLAPIPSGKAREQIVVATPVGTPTSRPSTVPSPGVQHSPFLPRPARPATSTAPIAILTSRPSAAATPVEQRSPTAIPSPSIDHSASLPRPAPAAATAAPSPFRTVRPPGPPPGAQRQPSPPTAAPSTLPTAQLIPRVSASPSPGLQGAHFAIPSPSAQRSTLLLRPAPPVTTAAPTATATSWPSARPSSSAQRPLPVRTPAPAAESSSRATQPARLSVVDASGCRDGVIAFRSAVTYWMSAFDKYNDAVQNTNGFANRQAGRGDSANLTAAIDAEVRAADALEAHGPQLTAAQSLLSKTGPLAGLSAELVRHADRAAHYLARYSRSKQDAIRAAEAEAQPPPIDDSLRVRGVAEFHAFVTPLSRIKLADCVSQ